MKKYILILLALTFTSFNYAQEEGNPLKIIDQFLTEEYPKNEPGAVILIAKKGKIVFKKAYGLASIKPKRKLKTNMVFPIASMTKQFTSAAILQLVEQGKISLQDTIQKYVPYYPSKKYPITIHHLLSQTSGIPDFFDVDEKEFHLLAQEHTPEKLIAYYKDSPLIFKPGKKWNYSNSNYPLLGVALEKVTGMSLKEYLRVNIFEPLEMFSSGLWYSSSIKKKKIPIGYNSKKGKLYEGPKMVGSTLYAQGGIVSSVQDLFLWNKALTNKKVISEYVAQQLTTEKTTNSGEGTGYGYGFFLRKLQGSPTIEHGGNLFSFTSGGLYLPEEDIFVCMLSNTKFDRVQEISNYIVSLLLKKPIQIFSKKAISKEMLIEYIGTYELQNSDHPRVFELKIYDNQLLLSDPKVPENDALLVSSDKDIFILKAVNVTFKFTRNKKGKISGYTLEQDGTYTFKKVK